MSRLSLAATAAPVRSTPVSCDPLHLDLESIRAEIDAVDDEILHLIQHRQRLAARIGGLKESQGSGLKLRPDREARVIARQAARVAPANRRLTVAIWRELMSAGLAAQSEIVVQVWSGGRKDIREAARARFGGCAVYRDAPTPEAALDAAGQEGTVAVLALDPESDWWSRLGQRPDLWIFDGLGRRGPLDPAALAVGRIEPGALARGVAFRVSSGGDSGMHARAERLLAVGEGCRLYAVRDEGEGSLDREHGVVGSAAG
jgi:chorismate mutase